MNQVKVARNHYHTMSPDLLATFSLGVRTNVFITNPGTFPAPPMLQAAFEAIIEDFETKRTAFVNGGTDQKGPYIPALALLMTTLDDFADMVDGIPSLTSAIVIEGGFVPTKESDSAHHIPVAGHAVVSLKRGEDSGVIQSECSTVPEAEYYHAILSNAAMPDLHIDNNRFLVFEKTGTFILIDQSKGRKKTFEGLTPGTTYYIYYWIGNAKGVSQITEVKSIMCA